MSVWLSALDNPLVVRALLAALIIAITAAPLGCLIVWNRLSYFGDSLAHAGFLGASCALIFQVNIMLGTVTITIFSALIMTRLQHRERFSSDSLLGVISHGALALALVLIALPNGPKFDIMAILQGEILLIAAEQFWWLMAMAVTILLLCWWQWPALMAWSISPDIAQAENFASRKHAMLIMMMIALFVGLCLQWVGVLMVASLLIIPAAAANLVARNMRVQVWWTMIFGVVAVVSGMYASLLINLPPSPAIIVVSTVLYLCSLLYRQYRYALGT